MKKIVFGIGFLLISTSISYAEDAFILGSKTYSVEELAKDNVEQFYEVDKQKYELISKLAKEKYLDNYFTELGKKKNISSEAAREEYVKKNTKITRQDRKEIEKKLKDYDAFTKLSEPEKKKQVEAILLMRNGSKVLEDLIAKAEKKGEIKILAKVPVEPIYDLAVSDKDHIRYSSKPDSIKPVKCSNNCPITIVEYSDFQCPYCSNTVEIADKLLDKYKGKIRWVTRDFPLDFHDKAKAAAIAAHCAGQQGKFWYMYKSLFANQKKLDDAGLEKLAKDVKGLDLNKWKACVKDPKDVEIAISENLNSGYKNGINGTPGFFLNGKKVAGALPYDVFSKKIEEELKAQKGKK